MLPKVVILSIVFLISQVNHSYVEGKRNVTVFNACFNHRTFQVKFRIEDLMCRVEEIFPKVPDGYTITKGIGCHKLSSAKKTWNDARKYCRNEKAYLASVDSQKEFELTLTMMKNRGIKQAWLGAHNLFNGKNDLHTNGWTTVKGQPMSYANWSKTCDGVQQPDNFNGDEHCLDQTINDCQDGFNDSNCELYFHFFCERSDVCI